MSQRRRTMTILLVEDDPDDRLLAKEALEESSVLSDLRCVENGEELMDYLYRRGQYGQQASAPRPALILLDLNLPKKDGRQVLNEIKADPDLRRIPIVVFTTSKTYEDIKTSYDEGANSFITKPMTFESLVEVMETLSNYWFGIVELPPNGVGDGHGQKLR